MQDLPDTPDERLRRRRMRRWKRRGRILGPFLAVPLLLFALSLSVDLIEYRPQPKRDRLSDRPIRLDPPKPSPAETTPPDLPLPAMPAAPLQANRDETDLELGRPAPPPMPYAARQR